MMRTARVGLFATVALIVVLATTTYLSKTVTVSGRGEDNTSPPLSASPSDPQASSVPIAQSLGAGISMEFIPNSKLDPALAPLEHMSPADKIEYTRRVFREIEQMKLAEKVGLKTRGSSQGAGLWGDETNPVIRLDIEVPASADAPQPDPANGWARHQIEPATEEKIRAFSSIVGLATNQQAVGYGKLITGPAIDDNNAVHFDLGRPINPAEILSVKNALYPKVAAGHKDPASAVAIIATARGFYVTHFTNFTQPTLAAAKANNAAFHRVIKAAAEEALPRDLPVEIEYTSHIGGLVESEDYQRGIDAAGESGRAWARDLQSRVDTINALFLRRIRAGEPLPGEAEDTAPAPAPAPSQEVKVTTTPPHAAVAPMRGSPAQTAPSSPHRADTTPLWQDAATALLRAIAASLETLPPEEEEPKPPPLDPPTRPRPPNPTVAKILATYGADVRKQFEPLCRRAGVRWPPQRVTLLAFKTERIVEVWAGNAKGPLRRLADFPILAASGTLGPKIQEGDRQVPEGSYRVVELNPASSYHLSFKIDYPNADDLSRAKIPRKKLGGQIYIHGDALSDGCLAMGFPVIEKLFCLMALAQPSGRRVIIAPVDFRRNTEFTAPADDKPLAILYGKLRRELAAYPLPLDDQITSPNQTIAQRPSTGAMAQ